MPIITTLSALVALLLLTTPLAAAAQPAKTIRIGWLSPGSIVTHGSFLDAFRQRLRELGYVEGRDVTIESRWRPGAQSTLTGSWSRPGRAGAGPASPGLDLTLAAST